MMFLPLPAATPPRTQISETIPPKGSQRRAAAIERLIRRLDGSNRAVFERLHALGEEAFTPLLGAVFLDREKTWGDRDPSVQIADLLAAAFRRGRTGELLAALERLPLGSS